MMKRTVYTSVNMPFTTNNATLRFITYEPQVPSKSWLIFLHGRGECGAADGSEITKVENPTSYAKHAKNGHDFPFNIIAPQCKDDFISVITMLPHWLRLYKDAEIIGMKGLSLGGQWCYNASLFPALKGTAKLPIDFIVPISAIPPDPVKYPACTSMDIPIYSMHGTNDSINNFGQEEKHINKLRACPDRKAPITFVPVQNGGHDTWNKAFELNPQNPVWQFIHTNLAPKVAPGYDQGYADGKAAGIIIGHDQGVAEGLATGITQGTAQGIIIGEEQGKEKFRLGAIGAINQLNV